RVEKLRGKWSIRTDWGMITVTLRPLRIGYSSRKGTPDEILIVGMSFSLLGEEMFLQVPVLLEMEEGGGLPASLEDAVKFVTRMLSGEEEDIYYKYLEVPMLVVGKARRSKVIDLPLRSKIRIKEIPSL
ncbi:unnamed protein product, partial [marine sediment metagenome]